jgi:thiol-disulfide isomerase/thioredoxin
VILFDYSYLRLTPHRFWWGKTEIGNSQAMSLTPPDRATWRHLGVEEFAGETCDIVDSALRTERLWIGRGSGRVRGVLSYYPIPDDDVYRTFYQRDIVRRIAGRRIATQWDYANWISGEATADQLVEVYIAWIQANPISGPSKMRLNEFVRFDDYREIRPGIWLPYRETRAFPHASDTVQGKNKLIRSELRVQEVRTDLSLADRFADLRPREGDKVQDQRFIAEVNLKHRANQTVADIRDLALAEYDRRLKDGGFLKRLIRPIAAMVGEPAPALPAAGWIGGRPPDLAGKPYLLHFWATWRDSCKGDFPRLKALKKRGVIVLGMHPPETPAEEVEKAIADHQLDYPTLLAGPTEGFLIDARICGYPAGVYPYCILVDAQGRVAGHGSLAELLRRFGVEPLTAPRKEHTRK